ncbi:MBL fold metallo-hydrolase [Tersicoccus sp. Bi-70]|uniref:MBL fold metallo-hydrolase n=1 Tax=Tersicoccus sp. Bi-70 TaxID=1897634 RepID=UPI000977BAE4|nr:MBL fold metallo-hydrolase [Tersicoccus sp. Bi-70]OMH33083.1 Zn-dependent hydrolase [Tersicoccus sp. Bi-70]
MTDIAVTALTDVVLRSISVGPMDNNVYLLTSRRSGAQVLIDAAADAPAIEQLLASSGEDSPAEPRLALIITTHRHHDHVGALAAVAERTGARTAAGRDDAPAIDVPTAVLLDHGDVGQFDGFDLEAIALRGHTPGSVALLLRDPEGPDHLFSGDSLFPGGVGRTAGPEDFASLYRDVVERVFDVLDDDTVVHPGHGLPTTIGAERPALPAWEKRGW